MASREFVMVVEESAWETPASTPTVWTTGTTYGLSHASAYYPRLDGDNMMSMRMRPAGTITTMYGGGVPIPAAKLADKQAMVGRLTMKLSISQAPFWLSWAGVLISGGTAPWTTTLPNGTLPSCALYHGITRGDNTIDRKVYLGTMVTGFDFSISDGSTVGTLSLDLIAGVRQGNSFDSSTDPSAGTFAVPADNNLPTDWFQYIHAGGSNFVTLGGAVRTQFTELHISVKNMIAQAYYANRFPQLLQFLGRTTTVATRLLYPPSSQADRTHYETLASESMSIEVNNGTHGFTMDFKAQNVFEPLEDDLKMADLYYQSSTSNNLWDPTAGTDFALTFA